MKQNRFLPVSKRDLEILGWKELDVILITGDAYVDHPSYGAALLGRMLEASGFKVGVIAQPDWHRLDDFKELGRPRLFFGITAGNLDSMVANYSANKKLRREDEYSPGGLSGRRPDRATIVYSNRAQEAFSGVPVIIGGMEASMRRLAHYDYWSEKVRRSMLLDSKADILVYGMAERQILEIAKRLDAGEAVSSLEGIRGTVIARNDLSSAQDAVEIPSFEEAAEDVDKFSEAFKKTYLESDPIHGKPIAQRHDKRYAIQFPPAMPLTTAELDRIYELPYRRNWHPKYDDKGGVSGFETVRFSITSHRGCAGSCNFCSLYLHQGRIIQSRSIDSILSEIRAVSAQPDFKGTITDIGGPTANLYKAECERWRADGACKGKSCLVPAKCRNLKLGYADAVKLWNAAKKIERVKHLFVGSGLRYDLLNDDAADIYLNALCESHISGQLKVAPEHTENNVLRLMNKPSFGGYEKFAAKFDRINKAKRKEQYLVNYIISGHPGARLEDALKLSLNLMKMRVYPEQIQDFIPLPMTASGCMFHTEKDPFTGDKIFVAKTVRERKMQRALVQYKSAGNKKYVLEALRTLDRLDLKRLFFNFRH